MKKVLQIMVIATVALLCCQCTTSKDLRQASKGAKSVPYTVLQNYYVRNDVDCSKEQGLTFYNKEDFEKYFGTAANMGNLPSEVDWKTQFVIAVVFPETDHVMNILPRDVKRSPGNIIFEVLPQRYRQKTSYKQVPFIAVAVDREANDKNLKVFYIAKASVL